MIGIVCFNSLRYAQYIYKYTNILDKYNIEYEIIFWNREGEELEKKSNWIVYEKNINTFQPFYKKIVGFLKYSYFLKATIKERKYDKLIILTSQTAVVLYSVLKKFYANKYIYDYRDITYENISLYKRLINKLVDKSYFTSISSLGFKKNLDNKSKLIMSHNTREIKLIDIEKSKNKKLRIVYWGMVRQPKFNYKICDTLANNDNIDIIYHGAGFHEEIKRYCGNKKYKNIVFTGAYELSEINTFVKNTDIILNSYENDKQQKDAMTVKFYDAIQYGIPMIVTKDSYMGEVVTKYKIGFVIDWEEDNVVEKLIREWKNFDFLQFEENRKKVFELVQLDDQIFENKLLEFINRRKKC